MLRHHEQGRRVVPQPMAPVPRALILSELMTMHSGPRLRMRVVGHRALALRARRSAPPTQAMTSGTTAVEVAAKAAIGAGEAVAAWKEGTLVVAAVVKVGVRVAAATAALVVDVAWERSVAVKVAAAATAAEVVMGYPRKDGDSQ